MIWGIVVLGVLLLASFLYIRWLQKEVDNWTAISIQRSNTIGKLFVQISDLSQDQNEYYKRVIQLENAIEKSFGVTVRQEITKINTDFTKVEWVVLLSGIYKLLDGAKVPEDAKIYLEIIDKVQSFMEHLKEEVEEAHGI